VGKKNIALESKSGIGRKLKKEVRFAYKGTVDVKGERRSQNWCGIGRLDWLKRDSRR